VASDLGLERYVEAFEANDIDTAVLRALSADDLKPDAAVGAGGSDHRRGLLEWAEPAALDISSDRLDRWRRQ
jgi:SAM domain (Sterile alpha motif)